VQAAENLDVVRGALGKVTEGLAVAFDTTFIGLVLSIVVMFPIHTLQKAEDDLLSAVDQYCNENLLSRLAADSGVASADSPEADGSLRQVMNAHLTALQDCQRRLERFETVLGEKASGAILLQDEPQTAADRGVANGVADR
jgi:flagellar motor component MotA